MAKAEYLTAGDGNELTTEPARSTLIEHWGKLVAGIQLVRPMLDKPYADDPKMSPYMRYIQPEIEGPDHWRSLAAGVQAVRHMIDRPFADAPESTPYTRYIQPELSAIGAMYNTPNPAM